MQNKIKESILLLLFLSLSTVVPVTSFSILAQDIMVQDQLSNIAESNMIISSESQDSVFGKSK